MGWLVIESSTEPSIRVAFGLTSWPKMAAAAVMPAAMYFQKPTERRVRITQKAYRRSKITATYRKLVLNGTLGAASHPSNGPKTAQLRRGRGLRANIPRILFVATSSWGWILDSTGPQRDAARGGNRSLRVVPQRGKGSDCRFGASSGPFPQTIDSQRRAGVSTLR